MFKGGTEGQNPTGGLIQASDGFLYGATNGGQGGPAVIFRIKPDGASYSVVYQFPSGAQQGSIGPALVQGSDGKLYGTLSSTADSYGTIFSLDLKLTPPVPSISYFSSTAAIGTRLLIRGDHLLAVGAVSFNGVPAQVFKGIGPYFVQAVVPPGATSGPISLSTPNGSTTSTETLTIN